MGDKIWTYIFGINALINFILITRHQQKTKSKNGDLVSGYTFWRAYFIIVPFFVTNSILKEIEKKKNKQNSHPRNPMEKLVLLLIDKGIQFDKGLLNKEIAEIETKFKIQFPIDYKQFLQAGLPISKDFVNWRLGLTSVDIASNIFTRLNWPLDGMLYDLQNNDFWIDDWGPKPDLYDKRAEITKQKYLDLPKMIPIYSHRYIPSEPNEPGNPVFSIHQMDIIYYGFDLASYFANEFHFQLPHDYEIPESPKKIRFWSDCIKN